MGEPAYRRVVVKLSGEYLAGDQPFGIPQPTIDRIAGDLSSARARGRDRGRGRRRYIFRGVEVSSRGGRANRRHQGMLATVMTASRWNRAERSQSARASPAFVMPQICELFTRAAPPQIPRRGRIVLLAGGTGSVFHHRHYGGAARRRVGVQAVLKSTKVDGVYSADPKKDKTATGSSG